MLKHISWETYFMAWTTFHKHVFRGHCNASWTRASETFRQQICFTKWIELDYWINSGHWKQTHPSGSGREKTNSRALIVNFQTAWGTHEHPRFAWGNFNIILGLSLHQAPSEPPRVRQARLLLRFRQPRRCGWEDNFDETLQAVSMKRTREPFDETNCQQNNLSIRRRSTNWLLPHKTTFWLLINAHRAWYSSYIRHAPEK